MTTQSIFKAFTSVQEFIEGDVFFSISRYCDKIHPLVEPTRRLVRAASIVILSASSPSVPEHVQVITLSRLSITQIQRSHEVVERTITHHEVSLNQLASDNINI